MSLGMSLRFEKPMPSLSLCLFLGDKDASSQLPLKLHTCPSGAMFSAVMAVGSPSETAKQAPNKLFFSVSCPDHSISS